MSRSIVPLLAFVVLGAGIVPASLASRVGSGPPPAASAVQASPQQSAEAQADESASIRHGVVSAVDEGGMRVQVQGIWLGVVAGKTQVLRKGQPARIDSLKAGEAIKFMLAPGGAEPPSLRVVYAP